MIFQGGYSLQAEDLGRKLVEVNITQESLVQSQPFANPTFNQASLALDVGVSGSHRHVPPCSCIS